MFLCVCFMEYLPEQAQLWAVFEHPNPRRMVTRNTPLHAPYSSRLAKVGPSGSCQQVRDKNPGITSSHYSASWTYRFCRSSKEREWCLTFDMLLFFPEWWNWACCIYLWKVLWTDTKDLSSDRYRGSFQKNVSSIYEKVSHWSYPCSFRL